MEEDQIIKKVFHVENNDYTFIGFRSRAFSTVEDATRAVPELSLNQTVIDGFLSVDGYAGPMDDEATYRKYVVQAYFENSIVDRIVFVCRAT